MSGAADRTTDERGASGEGASVEAATNTASEPTGPPPGTAPPWGRGDLDYARLEGDTNRPGEQAKQAAARDLGLWIPRLTTGEQLALAVSIRWLLTSRSRHLAEGTRTMADITFGHWTGHTLPATMDHPGKWHYVATRIMAHMGAYSSDEMNGLHWQWHQRAALHIRATTRTMISGKSLGHMATKNTPQANGGRGPKTFRSHPGGTPQLPGTPTGATTRDGFPLWHIRKPLATVCPAEGLGQSPGLGEARGHA